MKEAGELCERGSDVDRTGELKKALHDLCQPLTTLQCRLEMAGVVGTAEAYREAVELGLVECSRLLSAIDTMREVVRAVAHGAEQAGTKQ
jgi:signal transduction histidine kinase